MLLGLSASDTRFTVDKVEIAQAYSETSWPTWWYNFGWPCHLLCWIQWTWRFDIGQHTLPQFWLRWLDDAKKEPARASCLVVWICWQHVADFREGSSVTVSLLSASQEDDFCFDSLPTENTDARAQLKSTCSWLTLPETLTVCTNFRLVRCCLRNIIPHLVHQWQGCLVWVVRYRNPGETDCMTSAHFEVWTRDGNRTEPEPNEPN